MDYFNQAYDSFESDFQAENTVVLSIDKKRTETSTGPEVGLSWSDDVFNYMFDNMDFKRIEKFLSDSNVASYQNYIASVLGRQMYL